MSDWLDIIAEIFHYWFWTKDHEARWWVWALILLLIIVVIVLIVAL